MQVSLSDLRTTKSTGIRQKRTIKDIQLHLMILPSVVFVLIFNYAPMVGLAMAFEKFKPLKGIFHSQFVGLQHFKTLFSSPDSMRVISNTIVFSGSHIIFLLFVPLVFALLLNEVQPMPFKRFTQTFTYLPHFISWVILAVIMKDMLRPESGLINQTISAIFGNKSIFFLADNNWFRFIMIISAVWKEFGFASIILMAAIAGINPSMYESAYIDGSNRWNNVWHITLPSLIPILVVVFVLSLANILAGNFDQIFNLYNAMVYDKGDIIDTFVYRVGLIELNYSFSTAVGMFKSVISFILIIFGYVFAYRFADYRIF